LIRPTALPESTRPTLTPVHGPAGAARGADVAWILSDSLLVAEGRQMGYLAMVRAMPKRFFLLSSMVVAFLAVVWAFVIYSPRRGVSKANFDRVQDNATIEEVEMIFGEPSCATLQGHRIWDDGGEGIATILFENGHVIEKDWTDVDDGRTGLEKLL